MQRVQSFGHTLRVPTMTCILCVQTFVRLTNLKSKQEIIFVSEADNTLTNKFDLVSLLFVVVVSNLSTDLLTGR